MDGLVSQYRKYLCVYKDAVRHQMIVASYAAVPTGTAKWLVRITHTNTLAVMQGTLTPTSPTIKAGYSISMILTSHFEIPKGISA